MNINDLTIGQAKELAALFQSASPIAAEKFNPYEIGKNYQIRTVTHIVTGQVVSVGGTEIVLVDAAWVADTGRFADAVAKCEYNEVEPYPDGVHVIVGRTAVIDAVQIAKLPRVQK